MNSSRIAISKARLAYGDLITKTSRLSHPYRAHPGFADRDGQHYLWADLHVHPAGSRRPSGTAPSRPNSHSQRHRLQSPDLHTCPHTQPPAFDTDRERTFAARTAISRKRLRADPSILRENAVPERKVRPQAGSTSSTTKDSGWPHQQKISPCARSASVTHIG